MNFLRQQILPRPAFAQNQNRRIRGRHPLRHLKNAPHRYRSPEQSSELSIRHQLASQTRVFFSQLGKPQQIPDAPAQLFNIEALHNVIRRPTLQRFHRRLRRIQRRNHQHRYVVPVLPQPPQKRKPILPRHHQIQQNQIRRPGAQRLPRRRSRPRLNHLVLLLERPPRPVPRGCLVIHQQNCSHQLVLRKKSLRSGGPFPCVARKRDEGQAEFLVTESADPSRNLAVTNALWVVALATTKKTARAAPSSRRPFRRAFDFFNRSQPDPAARLPLPPAAASNETECP